MAGTRFSTSIDIDGKRVEINVPPNSSAWQLANSVFCPLGPAPTKAWLIVSKQTLSELDKESSHTVNWKQYITTDNSGAITETINLSFSGLYFVGSERILHGGVGDTAALHLLELADSRFLAARKSDTGQLVSNLRSYANNSDYLTGTTTYGTWGTLLEALWNACGVLGSFPGLPLSLPIDGAPQSHWLVGLNAYRALNVVLDQLDCALKHNPLTNTYTIVQLGEAQTISSANATLKWDGEPETSNIVNVAATVKVYFHNYRKAYGQERDTELDSNWAYNGQSESIDVATSVSGASGSIPLWDDLLRIYGENGTVTNSAALTTRANNRKSRYVTRFSVTYRHRIHRGLSDAYVPGGQIKACLWRNWGDGDKNLLGGTSTEYICTNYLVHNFKKIKGQDEDLVSWFDKLLDTPEWFQYSASDLGKHTYPNYPRLPNVVQIWHPSIGSGETVAPTSTYGLHRGRVRRWVANELVTLDNCWILFIDEYDTKYGQWSAIQGNCYGPGRLSGITTDTDEHGTSTLPVYLVYKGESETRLIVFQLIENLPIVPNTAATAEILELSGGVYVTTGTLITVVSGYNTGYGLWTGKIGYTGLAFIRTDGLYEIVYMERKSLIIEFTTYANRVSGEPTFQGTITSSYQQGDKTPTDTPITIYDTDLLFPRVVTGCKGKAIYNDVLDRYECLVVEQTCLIAKAKVNDTAGLIGEVTTTTITDFEPITQNPFSKDPIPAPTTALNRYALRGKDQDDILLVWDDASVVWVIAQIVVRERSYIGKASTSISKGSTSPVQIYVGGVATGRFINAKALGAAITANKWVTIWTDPVDGSTYVAPWECG